MNRGRTFLFNTILLTVTAILMRTVGLIFQVYLSKKIGAAGIGLFQLIMAVSMLAATLAISGIRFATTRLVSEELGANNHDGVKKAVRRCLIYALCFGTAAMVLLYFGSDFIGRVWVGDKRAVLPLRLLSLSLPAFSMSAVLSGYFTAVCRVIKSAAVSIAEQLIRMGVIIGALLFINTSDVEYACSAIVLGGVVGEASSFVMLWVLYLYDKRRYSAKNKRAGDITRRMFRIALPLALTAYARTALATLENLLIPRGFQKYGSTPEVALADYGMIQGMVFPVIAYPASLFYSLSELMVPELTDAQVTGNKKRIEELVSRTLRICLLLSVCILGILFTFSNELGIVIYQSEDVGHYIQMLAFLMPLMYLDTVTDGMLRGLGEQIYVMRVNILDAVVSVVLVYFLLPRFAIPGYIFMLYFTELFNFALSIWRLAKLTKIRFSVALVAKSLLSAAGSVNLSALLLRIAGFPLRAAPLNLTIHIIFTAVLYYFLIRALKCVETQDVQWFRKVFH